MDEMKAYIEKLDESLITLRININAIFNQVKLLADYAENLQTEIQKSFPTTFQKSYIISGGIIGGEIRGDLKGRKEGGKTGGGYATKLGVALKDFDEHEIQIFDNLQAVLFRSLWITEQQKLYLNSREQKILALKSIRKLKELKYSDENLKQAVFNAIKDGFWSEKFRHIKALANTSKNGCLVVDNLLKINSSLTKMNTPKTIVF